MTTEKKRRYIIDVLFIAIVLVVVYFSVKYILVWLLPFVIGLVAAIILQHPVAYLTEKTRLSRGLCAVTLVLLLLVLLFAILGVIMWAIVDEAPGLVKWITDITPDVKNTFDKVSVWLSGMTTYLPENFKSAIEGAPAKVVDAVVSWITNFATSFAGRIINDGPGLLIASIFSIVASCYITKDYHKITRFILCQLSDRKKELVISVKRLFVTNILKMLRGYMIIMFITFLELLIGLLILRVDYAPAIAAFIAVLDILPVLGTGTVLIPWTLISLLMGNYMLGIGLIILYVVITIIRNIIEPKIIGDQVGLPPIVTLVAMYVGLKVFGFIGMLLVPVTIIIIAKLQESGIIHIWNAPERLDPDEKPKLNERLKAKLFKKKSK